jgi:MFS transporter, DHA3 family, macrolide efflux protein
MEEQSADSIRKPPTKLFNKDFILLWQGQLVSQLGNQVHTIAMLFWIKHATGSATLIGTLMMLSAIPGVILGPLGGTFADRYSRRNIVLISESVSGLFVLILAAMLIFYSDRTSLIIAWLAISYTGMGILGAAFTPALGASVPDLVPPEKIASANSLTRASQQIASLCGQGLGGVLFRILGAPLLFLFDALSYLFSAGCVLSMKIPQKLPEKSVGLKAVYAGFKTDTIEGFRYVWSNRGLRGLIIASASLNYFLTPIGVLLPFYVEDNLKATPDWFGYMMAALGAGAAIGYLTAGTLKVSGRVRSNLIILIIFAFSITIGIFAFVTSAFMATVLFLILGFLSGTAGIYTTTVLQITTPTEIRGRVFGLMGTVIGGLMPIAMGLAGVLGDIAGKNIPLIFGICGGLLALISLLLSMQKDFRTFLEYEIPKK